MKHILHFLLLTIIVYCWSCSGGDEDVPTPAPKPETTKIEITTSAPVMNQKGGTATISFMTNTAWTANVGTSTSWLKVSPTSGVAGTHTLTVTTTENDTYDERNASITIKAGNANKSITVTQKQKDGLTVTSNKVEIGAEGGNFSIEAKANVSVTYEIEESAKDWISAIESRVLTTKALHFTAKANDKVERRQGNIIVKGGDGLTETVTVYQSGEEVSLVLTTPKDMTIGSEGGTLKIELESNTEIRMEELDSDWLRQSSSRAMSAYTYYIEVDANETYDERNASITFTSGDKKQIVTVTQKQKDALTVTSNKVEVNSDGGDFSIETKANVSVSYEIEESAKDWISAIESRALTTKTLHFTAKANDKIERRQGNILVKGGDGLTEIVTVYQAGEEPSLVLTTPQSMTIGSEGGVLKVELQSNLPDVQMHIGTAYTWIEPITTRSNSSYTFYLKVHPNESYDERLAIVNFHTENLNEVVYVIQKQHDALLITSNKVELSQKGGAFTLKLQSNVDVNYEIEEDAKSWINAVDSRGLTNTRLSFNATPNESFERRQGIITLKGGDNLTEIVTIYQEGTKKSLILSSKEYVINGNGETIKIELKSDINYKMILPDCAWISENTSRSLTAHSHYLDIAPNDNNDLRSEKILFVNEIFNLADTVHIIQVQKDAIVVAKNEYIVKAEECKLNFPVNSDMDIKISTDVDWIKQQESSDVQGNKLINFTISGNENTNTREGIIYFSGSNKNQTIKIKQMGCIDYEAIERATLVELYNATNGKNWSNNSNWCSDKPLKEWYGISINHKGRINALNLNNNNLIGYIPESIKNLTEIQRISLADNQLGFNIPENIENLIKLQSLDLSRNKLDGHIPESIGNLDKLRILLLDNNQLNGNIPEGIGNLIDLQTLNLSGNKLDGYIPESIGNLDKLRTLLLYNNQLNGNIPEGIGNLIDLQTLDLSRNKLDGYIPENFENLKNLSVLKLNSNQLNGKIPTGLTNLDVWKDCWTAVLEGNSQLDVVGTNIPAPIFTTVDVNDNTIDLGMEYINNKLTILYIWGGYPSHDKFYNTLIKLHNKYKDKGMKIFGSSISYITDNNIPWQNFLHYNIMENVLINIGSYPHIIAVNNQKQVVFQTFTYNNSDFIRFVSDFFQTESDGIYTSTDYTRDGEIVTLQTATIGKGINLTFMGEAFVDKDMGTGGKYEQKMSEAMEAFFSDEPYKSLRNRFNVFAIKVISPNAEFTEEAVHRLNKNNTSCFDYAKKIPESDKKPLMITVIYNTDQYIGRSYCNMYFDGSFVSYIMGPINNGVILHESGGHGFSGLLDEYIEGGNRELTLPEQKKNSLDEIWTLYGYGANIDWRNNTSTVKWAHFLNDNRYTDDGLGLYEGAYLYGYGAYRPTENSMMRYNNAPFNAPSREAIYKRIMQYSEGEEWTYDYEEFVKYDEINRNAISRSAVKPLTEAERREYIKNHRPPTFIKGSWRDAMEGKSQILVPLR
ncbi:MAG: hypothetical protein IJB61_01270 [Bacteroides sp]|nr:hypothetical protein [Bacteroides sp.]